MADELSQEQWLERQLAGAPAELARRTREFIQEAPSIGPAGLAAAADQALERAIASSPARRAALDLLAADALVTLALAAAVDVDPGGFEQLAIEIRARHGGAAADRPDPAGPAS